MSLRMLQLTKAQRALQRRPVLHAIASRASCECRISRCNSSTVLPSKPTWSVRELLRKRDDVVVDRADILKAASLCQISMDERQLNTVTKEVGDLLHFIKHVQDQDVEDIEPTYSVKDHINTPRPDTPHEKQPDQPHITSHAKEVRGDFFVVTRSTGSPSIT